MFVAILFFQKKQDFRKFDMKSILILNVLKNQPSILLKIPKKCLYL